MRARSVAAGGEARAGVRDSREHVANVGLVAYACWIAYRADDDEIVEHDLAVLPLRMIAERRGLRLGGVADDNVRVTAAHHLQGAAAAGEVHADLDAAGVSERRQQVSEQPGILDACRRGEHDVTTRRTTARKDDRRCGDGRGKLQAHVKGERALTDQRPFVVLLAERAAAGRGDLRRGCRRGCE